MAVNMSVYTWLDMWWVISVNHIPAIGGKVTDVEIQTCFQLPQEVRLILKEQMGTCLVCFYSFSLFKV